MRLRASDLPPHAKPEKLALSPESSSLLAARDFFGEQPWRPNYLLRDSLLNFARRSVGPRGGRLIIAESQAPPAACAIRTRNELIGGGFNRLSRAKPAERAGVTQREECPCQHRTYLYA